MIEYLFAYGTLQEGNPAHALLMPHIVGSIPHTVWGRHVDAGYEFPTVKFDGARDEIIGTLYTLKDMTDRTWASLDMYEAVDLGAFRRILLPQGYELGFQSAYVYEWIYTDDREDR